MSYKIFSTFTGAGGLDIGFHGGFTYLNKVHDELNFRTLKAIEIDEYACETIKANAKYFSNTEVICKDITKTNPKEYANKE